MRKIGKGYSLSIVVLFIVGLFLVSNTAYGIDTKLRNPVTSQDYEETLKRLLVAMILQLEIEIDKLKEELTAEFIEILEPLKRSDITPELIRTLFRPPEYEFQEYSPQEERIFALISEIRKKYIEKMLLCEDVENYIKLIGNKRFSPDKGICLEVNSCLHNAIEELELWSELKVIYDNDLEPAHTLVAIAGDRDWIFLDAAGGQYIPKYTRHIAVEYWRFYASELSQAFNEEYNRLYRWERVIREAEFPKIAEKLFLSKLQNLQRTISANL